MLVETTCAYMGSERSDFLKYLCHQISLSHNQSTCTNTLMPRLSLRQSHAHVVLKTFLDYHTIKIKARLWRNFKESVSLRADLTKEEAKLSPRCRRGRWGRVRWGRGGLGRSRRSLRRAVRAREPREQAARSRRGRTRGAAAHTHTHRQAGGTVGV